VTTLRGQRDELKSLIAAYEKRIEAARFDLMHVNDAAAIRAERCRRCRKFHWIERIT